MAGFDAPLLAGGDVFYLVFLGLCLVMIAGQTPADLKRRAKTEDEGIVIVVLITLATMAFFAYAVFTALNKKHGLGCSGRWCWPGSARRWAGLCCTR